jgi:hypothetical protein
MFLADKKDEVIGKDCSLNWRHGLEVAIWETYT